MKKHNPPKFKSDSFDCPHCGAYSQHIWLYLAHSGSWKIFEGLEITICTHCQRHTVWDKQTLVYPIASIAPQPSPDMPEDVAADYNEAHAVLAYSPRSSAALLRLALQKLCIYLGLPGKNLNHDIAALVKKGLSPNIQKALDIVRIYGNNAVHPGNIDLKDNQQSALFLFNLLNHIVEQMITLTRMIETTYENLPKETLEHINERDTIKTQQ